MHMKISLWNGGHFVRGRWVNPTQLAPRVGRQTSSTLGNDWFYLCLPCFTHWGRDEMNNISQMTFSNVFSSMKMFEFQLKFHWSLFPTVQLTIFQHWFRLWLGAVQATSHYLNQWWLVYRRIYASLGLNELRCLHEYSIKIQLEAGDYVQIWRYIIFY